MGISREFPDIFIGMVSVVFLLFLDTALAVACC